MKYLILLLLLSCGTEEVETRTTEPETVEVTVEGVKGDKGETGGAGTNGVDGNNGQDGTDGSDGVSTEGCYTQNELARTRWHSDHDDYYYDVLMICPDNVNYIARDVKYHEELGL